MKSYKSDIRKLAFLITLTLLICSRVRADILADWKTATGNAAFGARVFPASCVYDGKVWVIGGSEKIYVPSNYYNDVWYTTNGIDWTAATRNAAFTGRFRGTAFVFNGRMYLAAGNNGGYLKDVWWSTNGADWYAATLNAEFGEKSNQCQTNMVFDNKMWIIAGQNPVGQREAGPCKEVWYSSDGVEWIAATLNAEFDGRAGFSGTVYNGAMYIGGGAGQSGGYCNNIWTSTNGVAWTKLAEPIYLNMGASFQHESMLVFNGLMWILGGSRPDTGEAFDIAMWSTDGTTWTQDNAMVQVRNAGFAEVYNNKIMIGAGQANDIGTDPQPVLKDVMYSYLAASTPTSTITKTPYKTRTFTPTVTMTRTVTLTSTITPTYTITPTNTPTFTVTTPPTRTHTPTITETHTISPTPTDTTTITETWTVSNTHTVTPTFTVTATPTTVETLMIWHASNDTTGHKTDCVVCSRQYPDTEANPVVYTSYWQSVLRTGDYAHSTIMFNEDDINPSSDVACWVMQGFVIGDPISMTFTAIGGDLGISFMSNNITFTVGTP